ncbi:MAG: FAD/FMN-containing dehydrogenase [Deltaproteobacteria bacterium]|nr:MAG: FAD/FMN-containing dehydrogenase [Deltaproteobacteria bacterium]
MAVITLPDELKHQLQQDLGPDQVFDDPSILKTCASDASKAFHLPHLVVRPDTVTGVQKVLHLASEHRVPVYPRGGGSGLAGGCLAEHGGIVLQLTGLNRLRSLDDRNFTMEVEAGVLSSRVRDAAAEAGMYYPPDPAGMELSTIGGNAATDAGGPACLKYGTTRDYILGVEAVLPNGELLSTGVKTRKGVVGYDLCNLLIGSEGTLAIITALTLKLLPRPGTTTGMIALFTDMGAAMDAVASIMASGHLPSALEFLDYRCVGLIRDLLPVTPPEGSSMLIVEVDGGAQVIDNEIREIEAVTRKRGALHCLQLPVAADRQRIWEVRRQVSLRIRDQAGIYFPEDIAVPLSAIERLVNALPACEARHNVEIYGFGHAGDGNIHLSVITRDADGYARAHNAVVELLELAVSLDGTISGEHGIGLAKREFITMELSSRSLALQRQIKNTFDPYHILNPGKVFPDNLDSTP